MTLWLKIKIIREGFKSTSISAPLHPQRFKFNVSRLGLGHQYKLILIILYVTTTLIMRNRRLGRVGGTTFQTETTICAKALRWERARHVKRSEKGLMRLVCCGGRNKRSKINILRDRHTITKPIRDSYLSPSVNLLMLSKNSICQGRSLGPPTSILSSSRKFSMESQITIMITYG